MTKNRSLFSSSSSRCSSKKGGTEEVVQCPHLHFKTDVIDRNVLSKEQHLNLLSTPKGYRWGENKNEGGDSEPAELSVPRRIMCTGRRMKKAEKVYVHNFLAEVWNLLTPEMVDRLKGMLMNEFGMSPQEADDFVCRQREANVVNSSTVSFYKKRREVGDGKYVYDHVVKMRDPNTSHCDKIPKSSVGPRNSWIKDFSDIVAEMTSSYVLETMCAERTDRQQEIAKTLLDRFNTLLEQDASFSDPKSQVDKTLVLVADRLATWLDNNVGVSKEAAQRLKNAEETVQKKRYEEDRKRRQEERRREQERQEAEEAAEMLVDNLFFDEDEATEEEEVEDSQPGQPTQDTMKEDTDEQQEQPPIGQKYEEKEELDLTEEKGDSKKEEESDDQKKKEEEEVAAEQQQEVPEEQQEVPQEQEKEETAADEVEKPTEEVDAEKQAAENEQPTAEQEEVKDAEKATEDLEKAPAEGENQMGESEQKTAEQEEIEAEKQRAEEEQKRIEQEAAEAEKQKEIEAERLKEEEEKEKAAELEKEQAEEAMKNEPDIVEVPADLEEPTKSVAEEEPSEKPVEEEPVVETPEPEQEGLSPTEVEQRTEEVLKSVTSIILDTTTDPTPRQEAIKDIVGKHLEDQMGDEDKGAIDKVAGKIGTWVDKMVDQAALEYGERQRPSLGPDVQEPGAKQPISLTDGMKPPGMVPIQPRVVPLAQRPKGSIYHVSRLPSESYDVDMVSNTVAQEKIRLARGRGRFSAYANVPNPDAPMKPTDFKNWHKWTFALSEVAGSWAEWLKDTIKGTQQRGKDLLHDKSPERVSEWKEFLENRSQSARKWQQTKKDMEQRAELWAEKRRRVQSQEANRFLRDQGTLAARTKPKSKQVLMRENRCNSATPMVIKNYLRKSFAEIMAVEIEDRIIQALCSPRTKQNVDVAERLLKVLADVTGEQCTLQTPKSGTQRILVFMADQMAVWLVDAVDRADTTVIDRKEKGMLGIEGGKGDGQDDEDDEQSDPDVEIIHRKKRPSNVSRTLEGSGDGTGDPSKAGKKTGKTSKTGSDGKDGSDSKGQSQADLQKKKQGSEGGVGGKTASSRSSTDRRKDDGDKKSKAGQQEAGKGPGDRRGSAQPRRSGSGQPGTKPDDASRSSQRQPRSAESSQRKTSVPAKRSSQSLSKQDANKPARTPSRQMSSSENKRVSDSKRPSKSAEQRPRTASELQREKIGEIVSSHVINMMKEGSIRQTPRSEALKDVISKKLEISAPNLDKQALKEASAMLASYIDKQAENVELEYGTVPPPKPIAQKGKGPVFSVKPAASAYLVKETTHTIAAAKTAKARGRPVPGAITLSKGGFNPKESKDWANWANEVVNMADKWSKWIDSTVSKAVTSAEMKKSGKDVPEWQDWKEKVGEEALEWRRNKKLLQQSAALFQEKVDRTNKALMVPPKPLTIKE